MQEDDKDNLDFLLKASPEVLRSWYDSANEDDLKYATELLADYGKTLTKLEILKITSNIPVLIECKFLH